MRKVIESISSSSKGHEEKAQLINIEFDKLIKLIESIGKNTAELYEKKEIQISDFDRILSVLKNISDYIYNKYGEYKEKEKEVETVITSLYNPAVAKEGEKRGEERGKEIGKEIGEREKAFKIARKALKEGADVDFVVKITELNKETVEKIKEELQS